MKFESYPDRDMLFIDLAGKIAEELEEALHHEDTVSLAVPGGTTPGPVFDELSAANLDWSRVRILLTDERRVPADHARSNERLLRERLLVNRASAASFVRLVPEDDDLSALHQTLSGLMPLNVVILGMGADMHTASLFPGAPQLADAIAPTAPPLMMVDAAEGLEPRLTLTGPALKGALSIHVLITGAEKRNALETARGLYPDQAPIALVLDHATVHWAE